MVIFDFFASAFLGVLFSAAPRYWKNCTDREIRSLVDRLFLVLTIAQCVKMVFCAAVLVARFLK